KPGPRSAGHAHDAMSQPAPRDHEDLRERPFAHALECVSPADSFTSLRCYFFLPDAKPGCHPAAFWLGAAAIVLIFSFLGFLASRLPFCSPLAISISFGLMMTPYLHAEFHIVA